PSQVGVGVRVALTWTKLREDQHNTKSPGQSTAVG
ncbi:hypothetical protein ABH939_005417, partial [Rhodococcus sp. 27YEA6]